MRLLRHAPPALWIGVLFGLSGTLASLFQSGEIPWPTRWNLYSSGAGSVGTAMLALGLADLSRRLEGRTRTASRLAAAMFALLFLWGLVRDAIVLYVAPSSAITILQVSGIGASALYTAVIVLLATASKGWLRASGISILGIAALLLNGWVPVVSPAIQQVLFTDLDVARLVLIAVGPVPAIAILLLAALVVRSTPDPIADPSRFSDGLRWAVRSIQFRVFGAMVIALVSLLMAKYGWEGTRMLVMVVAPGVLLIAMISCACGLHLAAQSRVEGVPVLRLCLGAAVTLWWVGVQSSQLTWLYRELTVLQDDLRPALELIDPWSIGGPAIAMGGLALVGTGIASFAAARGDAALRRSASTRTLVCVLLFAASLGIQPRLMEETSLACFTSMCVALAVLVIGSLVAISGLFARAAASLRDRSVIPQARSLPK